MDTRPRVEHYSPGPNRMPSPGSKPDPERPNFYFGADHGRMERQVAVQISLTDDFTPDQIANAHKVLRDATEKVWPLAGLEILLCRASVFSGVLRPSRVPPASNTTSGRRPSLMPSFAALPKPTDRSDERRVGHEGVSTCRFRW